jgi:hypothetical protein
MSTFLVQQVIPVTAIVDEELVVGEGAVTTRVLDARDMALERIKM